MIDESKERDLQSIIDYMSQDGEETKRDNLERSPPLSFGRWNNSCENIK